MPASRPSGKARTARTVSNPTFEQAQAGPSSASDFILIDPISSMPRTKVPSTSTSHSAGKIRASRTKKNTPSIPHEVIEISSDDDDQPPVRRPSVAPPASSASAKLRKENRKLREDREFLTRENDTLHAQLQFTRQKVRSLEIENGVSTDKLSLNASDLEDITSCNICTNTMFTPFILSFCGHTFCQKCLTDWFDSTLRNFMATHPNYNPNYQLPAQLLALMQQPGILQHPQLAVYLQSQIPAKPQYTCPECRAPVTTAPAENFAMKSLSVMVASARKESIPPAPVRPRIGPWEGYFPSAR